MKLNEFDGCTLTTMLANGSVSSREILTAVLDRIDQADGVIGAFLTVRDRHELLKQSDEIDTRRSRGQKVGALAGLPVAIKDNICTKGLSTTCASKMLEGYLPPYDATVIDKIREADGIILGKTNMDEFSMGSSTENSAYKVTRNPHNVKYVPGGTSGGSAAAVAANETIFAIGSDTGGSIRQPASYCGVVGLKPTYGMVSRYGLIAYASSLDQVGTLTKTPSDARLLLSVIAGHDPLDATSAPHSPFSNESRSRMKLRIGVPREYFIDGVDADVAACGQRMVAKLLSLGHDVVEATLPHTKYAVPSYYVIAAAEMSANLERYDGCRFGHRSGLNVGVKGMMSASRTEGLGQEVRRRILLGTYVLSAGYYDAYYDKALRVRSLITDDFVKSFSECDVLMTPVSPTPAFKIGAKTDDPIKMYLMDIFSVTANLAGIPGISVPFGFNDEGLPLSMQFLGPSFSEAVLIDLAGDLTEATT